jgi:hypothetical protein
MALRDMQERKAVSVQSSMSEEVNMALTMGLTKC